MIVHKAYKFRLKTNPVLTQHMACVSGCARLVWNKTLAEQKARLDRDEGVQSYSAMCKALTAWKHTDTYAFLRDVPSQVLQQNLKDLCGAFDDFFNPVHPDKGFPQFKKKLKHDSFRFPQDVKVDGNRVFLPKIGWVRFFKRRNVEGVIKNATVSRQSHHWYVSIQVEVNLGTPVHPATSTRGVDRGVAVFAALSDGTLFPSIHAFRTLEKKLVWEQRKLSRKCPFSRNWSKQKARLQRLHGRIADTRRCFLHQVSTAISKNHAMIVMEDLDVRAMSASAKGTINAPGHNVAGKSGLNKAILDQGWGEFLYQPTYKQHWRGGAVMQVSAAYTSQQCSACSHIDPSNRPTRELFHCVQCGYTDHADVNAAKNILRAGHARLACSVPSSTESTPDRGSNPIRGVGRNRPKPSVLGIHAL